ncbi:IMPACT family protein [Deinococcus multiflagellatus]|uniref:IMPACT family protein n=1 Tax=Deinococcus multiflagellatus TaxID=1656887 RepID=A0ABW1ZJ69_9DEIO|nr:YigZ family protein [Deinococcus multiflagellatus]MBZ9712475.1 IMPACT family protein [Deinococcus multiflagellatus]
MARPRAAAGPGPALSGPGDLPAPFTTLAGPWRENLLVENSEFLAFAERADAPEQALAQLNSLRGRYPDATHCCWAYRIGPLQRFHDDGEPGGTAGAPILKAIEGQGLDHVMVVVVRFYGGVKLGTGGLARAYSGAAAACLRAAPKDTVRPRLTLRVQVPFAHLSRLHHLLGRYSAGHGEEHYGATGVSLSVQVFPEDAAAFTAELRDATRGEGVAEPA